MLSEYSQQDGAIAVISKPNSKFLICSFVLLVSYLGLLLSSCAHLPLATTVTDGVYQHRTVHSSDGIGKFYLGREIAQVMGHRGAFWLERSSREWEERPSQLVEALNLRPTDVVADIGAGTGFFSFRLSPLVPEGKVLAVDIQPEMLDIITFLKHEDQIDNVEPILGNVTNPNLPAAGVDLVMMVDAYHEFEYPREMMEEIVRSLKPNGRVVLAEYRGENPFIPIKGLHKMTQRQVRKEMQAVGLVWQETKDLPQQHLMVFRKDEGWGMGDGG